MNPKLKAVERDPAEAVCSAVVKAGTGWLHEVRAGQILRIVDLCGNQSADVLLYNAHDTAERYNVNNTIAAQRSTLIELGTELRSNDDNVMFTVVADTCGEHDTLGSGCSAEGNAIRYTDRTRFMHSCRDTFVRHFSDMPGMSKRPDLQPELLHQSSARRDGEPRICGRHLRPGQIRGSRSEDGRAGAALQLCAAEQSLQRLQPDSGANAHLGCRERISVLCSRKY